MTRLVKSDESNNVFFICLTLYDSKRHKKTNWKKGAARVIVKSNISMPLLMVRESPERVAVGKHVAFSIFLHK